MIKTVLFFSVSLINSFIVLNAKVMKIKHINISSNHTPVKVLSDISAQRAWIKYNTGPFCSYISLYGTRPDFIPLPTVKNRLASFQRLKGYSGEEVDTKVMQISDVKNADIFSLIVRGPVFVDEESTRFLFTDFRISFSTKKRTAYEIRNTVRDFLKSLKSFLMLTV